MAKKSKISEIEFEKTSRGSYTMPEEEFKVFDVLIDRCLDEKFVINRCEIIRIGLNAIKNFTSEQLKRELIELGRQKIGPKTRKMQKQ